MPAYQRIAVLVIRLAGIIWTFVLSVFWLLYLLELLCDMQVQRYPPHTVVGNLAYMVIGAMLVLVAKPLVRFCCRDLER